MNLGFLRWPRRPAPSPPPAADLRDAAMMFFVADVTGTIRHLRTVMHDDIGPAAATLRHARDQLDDLAARVAKFEATVMDKEKTSD